MSKDVMKKLGKSQNLTTGFTVAEMIVSVGLFTVVAMISTVTLLTIVNSNKKAETLKSVINNLNFAVESMARNLRMGTNYHCNNNGNLTVRQDCLNGGQYIAFLGSDGKMSGYQWIDEGGGTLSIEKLGNFVGSDFGVSTPITAPDVVIQKLTFYVSGTDPNDKNQPNIFILLSGYAKSKDSQGLTKSSFQIETMVSQRLPNYGP